MMHSKNLRMIWNRQKMISKRWRRMDNCLLIYWIYSSLTDTFMFLKL